MYCTYKVRQSLNGKSGYYQLLLWVVTMYSRLVTYSYCCQGLLCILITSGMPKTEAINWRLVSNSTAHIGSGRPGYYMLLLWVVTMSSMLVTISYFCKRLPCILTTSGIPKTEAANWQLVFKCTAHIRSGQAPSMENLVTTGYCS